MRAPLFAAALLLGGCSIQTVAAADGCGSIAAWDSPYLDGAGIQQRIDVYRPGIAGCTAVPVVVWVHGGAWKGGSRHRHIEPKVRLWNDAGWAVATVDYRLTDPADPPAERLVAPAHGEDVAAAVAWLRNHAADLGLDRSRLALLGHSAGGGIAAAVALDPAHLASVGLDPTVVRCAGLLDAEGVDIRAAIEAGGHYGALYPPVFGDDPDRWDELSPLTHVGDAEVPDLFVVTRNRPEHQAVSEAVVEAAEAAGADGTLLRLPRFSHGDVSTLVGDPDDTALTPALQRFLRACLR